MDAVLIYSTWPDAASAEACAQVLIAERAAACATCLPGGTSIYRWEGRIERANEAVLLVKTRRDKADDAKAIILSQHCYDLPCVLVATLDSSLSHGDFLAWIASETG